MKAKNQKVFTAKIYQYGLMIASTTSQDKEQTEREIQHYALMYSQDGEVTIRRNYKLEDTKSFA